MIIIAVNFHSSGNLLLTASSDKVLRFFRVDGEKNEKQLSVEFKGMPILSSFFIPLSNEVIVSGRKPYFCSYDTVSGHISKYPGTYA
jgi:U3 small nucleolar RNA-associated protein 18